MQLLGREFRDGRAGSAPALRTEGGATVFEIIKDGSVYMVHLAWVEEKALDMEVATLVMQQRARYGIAHDMRD